MSGLSTAVTLSGATLRALKDKLRSSPLMRSLPETKSFDTWHGSPYTFVAEETAPLGRFRNDKLGSGEGAQAFTYGHYTTGSKNLATEYRDTLARKYGTDGKPKDARLTKKQMAEVAPDAVFIPPQRFNTHATGNPATWIGADDAPALIERMMPNPTWTRSYADPDMAPRVSRYGYAGPSGDQIVARDPMLRDALRSVRDSSHRDAWLPDTVLDSARGRVSGLRQLQSAELMRQRLGDIPPEAYAILAKDLNLPSAANEVTPSLWRSALSDLAETSQVASARDRQSDLRNSAWAMLQRERPQLKSALEQYFAVPENYTSANYVTDMTILGRNGLLDFTRQLSDPARLKELRSYYGITEGAPKTSSLYKVTHDVSPNDLWFLDSPLIGQSDDFIRRFQQAGKALTPDFGSHASLGARGHDTYDWLKNVRSMSSMPGTTRRNAEITDKLIEAEIPGAMFLRGGHRDFNKALEKRFDPFDYNFVTYNPDTVKIIERRRQGGLIGAQQ